MSVYLVSIVDKTGNTIFKIAAGANGNCIKQFVKIIQTDYKAQVCAGSLTFNDVLQAGLQSGFAPEGANGLHDWINDSSEHSFVIMDAEHVALALKNHTAFLELFDLTRLIEPEEFYITRFDQPTFNPRWQFGTSERFGFILMDNTIESEEEYRQTHRMLSRRFLTEIKERFRFATVLSQK